MLGNRLHIARLGGAVPLEFAYMQTATDVSDALTYTFSGQNIGAAAADRTIVVSLASRGSDMISPSVTIGGIAATIDVALAHSLSNLIIARAVVPTGTTADIVVNWGNNQLRAAASTWRVIGNTAVDDTATLTGLDTSPTDIVLTPTSSGGLIIASAITVAVTSVTWAEAVERFDSDIEAMTYSTADTASAAPSDTVTVTLADAGSSNLVIASAYKRA